MLGPVLGTGAAPRQPEWDLWEVAWGSPAWVQVHCFSYSPGKLAFPLHLTGRNRHSWGETQEAELRNSWGGCEAV